MTPMRKWLKKQETILALFLLLLCLAIGHINPSFLSLSNFYDLCKSGTVMGIMALGVLLVMISGGIDVSFAAIAAFSMYSTSKILVACGWTNSIFLGFLFSAGIGLFLGLMNAVFIACFDLPALIVTLGTASLFRGFLLGFIGTSIVNNLPDAMVRFSKMTLWGSLTVPGTVTGLSTSFVIFMALAFLTAFILRYTLLGRGIYAMGGNSETARRIGFHCVTIRFFLYGFVGMLSGVAGLIHSCMMRNANPFGLVGMELDVIAAVVLGGSSLLGGYGTVLGTVLGVFILVVIKNSLILLGIPSYWQSVASGLAIVLSAGISSRKQGGSFKGVIG